MVRRFLPAVLAIVAAIADAHGAYGLAFDALLGAIPFAAVSALVGFGEYLEHRAGGLQVFLSGLVLGLLVLSCAARSPATQTHSLPALGASALVGCLAMLALKAAVAAAPYMRRLTPAKP